jgi:hypothetical protein
MATFESADPSSGPVKSSKPRICAQPLRLARSAHAPSHVSHCFITNALPMRTARRHFLSSHRPRLRSPSAP